MISFCFLYTQDKQSKYQKFADIQLKIFDIWDGDDENEQMAELYTERCPKLANKSLKNVTLWRWNRVPPTCSNTSGLELLANDLIKI